MQHNTNVLLRHPPSPHPPSPSPPHPTFLSESRDFLRKKRNKILMDTSSYVLRSEISWRNTFFIRIRQNNVDPTRSGSNQWLVYWLRTWTPSCLVSVRGTCPVRRRALLRAAARTWRSCCQSSRGSCTCVRRIFSEILKTQVILIPCARASKRIFLCNLFNLFP